eukprot:scaffold33672_cov70-Phaeocystis_antarctica.AAC.3
MLACALDVVACPQRAQHVAEAALVKGGRAGTLPRQAGDAQWELGARGHADAAARRRAVQEK